MWGTKLCCTAALAVVLITGAAAAAADAASKSPLAAVHIRGSGFTGGPMAATQTPLGGPAARRSLAALAATGASHVRLYSTWYQSGPNATEIAPYTRAESPLRSETDAELKATLAAAGELGLAAILSPRLDLNWDSPATAQLAPYNASTASIGASFAPSQWSAWFAAYSTFVHHHAMLCTQASHCGGLVLADELHTAFAHVSVADWQTLASSTRKLLPKGAALLVMTSRPDTISWWGHVDFIGFNAEQTALTDYRYMQADTIITAGISVPWPPVAFGEVVKLGQRTWGKGVTLGQCKQACSLGVSHSSGVCTAMNWDAASQQCHLYTQVTQHKPARASSWRSFQQEQQPGAAESCHDTAGLVRTWKANGIMANLTALHARYKIPVVLSFGYQSRPDAHRAPDGAIRPGYTDCSVWLRCYDDACQASLASAALSAFSSQPFFAGALWSYWSTDPTQGGRSDSSRSPRGKMTEGVLRKWFGAESLDVPPIDVTRALPAAASESTGAGGTRSGPAPAGARNGYVFGTGEWSATNLSLAEAQQSIDNAV